MVSLKSIHFTSFFFKNFFCGNFTFEHGLIQCRCNFGMTSKTCHRLYVFLVNIFENWANVYQWGLVDFNFNAIEVLHLCIYEKSHWILLVRFCHWICTSASMDSIAKVLPCASMHKITFPLNFSTLKNYIQHAHIQKPTLIYEATTKPKPRNKHLDMIEACKLGKTCKPYIWHGFQITNPIANKHALSNENGLKKWYVGKGGRI